MLIWEEVIHSRFKAESLKQKELVRTSSEAGAWAWLCVEDVNNVLPNQFGISGHPEPW